MTTKTDFFWTDTQQTEERLRGSVILYDDRPHQVVAVEGNADGVPRLHITPCGGRDTVRKKANSPAFNRFRELPNLGWMPVPAVSKRYLGASSCFVERVVRRGMRSHGLTENNTRVTYLRANGETNNIPGGFNHAYISEGFSAMHAGQYPPLSWVLANVGEGDTIAYSRKYAVFHDTQMGLKWLYRNLERVGLFSGEDTLLLSSKFSFYREEILADPLFTLDNLREF